MGGSFNGDVLRPWSEIRVLWKSEGPQTWFKCVLERVIQEKTPVETWSGCQS